MDFVRRILQAVQMLIPILGRVEKEVLVADWYALGIAPLIISLDQQSRVALLMEVQHAGVGDDQGIDAHLTMLFVAEDVRVAEQEVENS